MRRKRCQDDNDWLYAEVGQKMIEWLELIENILQRNLVTPFTGTKK